MSKNQGKKEFRKTLEAKPIIGTLLAMFTLMFTLMIHSSHAASPTQGNSPSVFQNLPTILSGFSNIERLRIAHDTVVSAPGIKEMLNDQTTHALSIVQRIANDGIETTKFQHYYKGLEVVGSMSFHHLSTAGATVRDRMARFDLDTRPGISPEMAVSLARSLAGDRPLEGAPELKILPRSESATQLVYWIQFGESSLDEGREIILDAHTGELVGDLPAHLEITPPTQRPAIQTGTQTGTKTGGRGGIAGLLPTGPLAGALAPINIFSAKNQGIVFEPLKNGAVVDMQDSWDSCRVTNLANNQVSQLTKQQCDSLSSFCQAIMNGRPQIVVPQNCQAVFSNGRPAATADNSSTNAFNNSSAALSYYKTHHNRNSFDNLGSPLISVVHAGINFENAFWNVRQKIMVYGDGNPAHNLGDFSGAVDVAGHELTHGVISHTANLGMMGEAGALNESYADFFGKMIENADDWAIGRKISLNPATSQGLRNLADPSLVPLRIRDQNGQPLNLKYPTKMSEELPLQKSCDISNDFCWVHINTTIPGHAAYLIVKAIGKDKAEKLYYATLTQAISPSEDFKGMAAATIEICNHLYDAASCAKVKDSFAAVGL